MIIIIIRMQKKIILVHCMHGLRMPFLYKRKSYAEKKCINEPGYQLSEFDSENDAKEIFNIKMEEYQKALNKTKMDILKSHLDKANMPLMTENSIPQQSKYIETLQRENREKIVNQLFVKHGFLNTPTFKSHQILVSPLIQYQGFFDGATKRNPGPSSAGYLLKYLNTTLFARSEKFGQLTSNQAQMMSMGYLLAHCYCNGVQHLKVVGDSKLAIDIVTGKYTIRAQHLLPLYECNKYISKTFRTINFKHVKRDFNKEANKLANEIFSKSKKKNENQKKPQ